MRETLFGVSNAWALLASSAAGELAAEEEGNVWPTLDRLRQRRPGPLELLREGDDACGVVRQIRHMAEFFKNERLEFLCIVLTDLPPNWSELQSNTTRRF